MNSIFWKWQLCISLDNLGFFHKLCKIGHLNVFTLQRVCLLRKLNGVGLVSGGWSTAKERSTDSFTIRGGVPVLSLPILSLSLSLSVWESPALDGASPTRPPGTVVWPTKREPARNVPVVRTTELAETNWLPFAEKVRNWELLQHFNNSFSL